MKSFQELWSNRLHMLTASEIIKLLKLEPHPAEGGYFCETYRCSDQVKEDFLPLRFKSDRSLSTAIYYLITNDSFSSMHKLITDEIFHFYLGSPVSMLLLYPDNSSKIVTVGSDISSDQKLQVVVPRGTWQGAYVPKGEYALLGTTMSPGFDSEDFMIGKRDDLLEKYTDHKELITKLTTE